MSSDRFGQTTADNNNSSVAAASSCSSTKFAFRPSKLTSVAEKIWKKDATPATNNSTNHVSTGKIFNLIEKPTFSTPNKTTGDSSSSSVTSTKPFIFGQNIKERVVIKEDPASKETTATVNKEGASSSKSSHSTIDEINQSTPEDQSSTKSTSNEDVGSTSSTAKFVDFKHFNQEPDHKIQLSPSNTLEESARTYEETKSLSNKVKLAEHVDIKTGEEDEINILHAICKLHIFDHDKQTWEERGTALWRLNECNTTGDYGDDDQNQVSTNSTTRIVVRLHGSLKVMVNSRLFSEMLVERLSPKRLKLSALDFSSNNISDQNSSHQTTGVILYLITANQNDIDKIERVIRSKLVDLKYSNTSDASDRTEPTLKRKDKNFDKEQKDEGKIEEKKLKTN